MAARALHRLFDAAPELAALTDHANRILRLQEIYARVVPDYLAEVSRVVNAKEQLLVIHADNAAVAAKLKQLEPRLRGELALAGYSFLALQFKVQPRRPDPQVAVIERDSRISSQAREHLAAAADNLPADSPVRAALERMLAKST